MKNFHWHVSGPHFRDYHLLLDEQADQIFATTDAIAERVRKLGGTTLRSIGQVSRLQRLTDNDADYVADRRIPNRRDLLPRLHKVPNGKRRAKRGKPRKPIRYMNHTAWQNTRKKAELLQVREPRRLCYSRRPLARCTTPLSLTLIVVAFS